MPAASLRASVANSSLVVQDWRPNVRCQALARGWFSCCWGPPLSAPPARLQPQRGRLRSQARRSPRPARLRQFLSYAAGSRCSNTSRLDLLYLTDRIRTAALRAGPSLYVGSRENLIALLQASGKTMEQCEGECDVETGRLVGADLVMSGEALTVDGIFKLPEAACHEALPHALWFGGFWRKLRGARWRFAAGGVRASSPFAGCRRREFVIGGQWPTGRNGGVAFGAPVWVRTGKESAQRTGWCHNCADFTAKPQGGAPGGLRALC
jgi:hypothetical protein